MRKRIPVQRKIIEALREIKRMENVDWVEVRTVILMVYRRSQVDPQHPDYRGKNWYYTTSEAVSVFRAIKKLEVKGALKRRLVKLKDRYRDIPKERRWGQTQVWTEIRLMEE